MSTSFLDLVKQVDDTDVALDAKTFVDQTSPKPPAPGVYGVKVMPNGFNFARDKAGTIITTTAKDKDGQERIYHTFSLDQVQIVEPVENKRTVMLYQRVSGNSQGFGINILHLLKGFDNASAAKGRRIYEEVGEYMERGQIFYVRLDWEANDYEWVSQQIDLQSLRRGVDKVEINALYTRAKLKGFKNFPQVNGQYSHQWEGPSGIIVEARPVITRIFASNAKLPNLGIDPAFSPF